jgi:protein-tyrosine phosphatase
MSLRTYLFTTLSFLLILGLSNCARKAIPVPTRTLKKPTRVTRDLNGVYTIQFEKEGTYQIYAAPSIQELDWSRPLITLEGDQIELGRINPAKRYYFGILDQNGTKKILSERLLPIEGTPNFRDLGGLMTKDDRMVSWGKIYRSSNLADLSSRDLAYIQNLGLKSVADLRYTSEIEKDPDVLPIGVGYYHFPIGGKEGLFYQQLKRKVLKEGLRRKEAKVEFVKVMSMFADSAAHDFKPVMDLLIKGDETTPLVYHCSGGKDRTGYMSMVILAALGVEKETIRDEYLMSNFYRYKKNKSIARKGRLIGIDPETLEYILVVQAEYFDAVFDVIENKYGGIDNYLLEKYDITPEIRQQLIDRYTIKVQ